MKVDVSLTISLKRSSLHCEVSSDIVVFNPRRKAYLGGVHLVDGNDELSYTQSECEESVFTGLAILGDTSFEFTSTSGNDEDSAISLGGTGDHVLDEVTVSGGVDDLCGGVEYHQRAAEIESAYGNHVLGGLELPEGNVYRDTTLALSLQLIEHPC